MTRWEYCMVQTYVTDWSGANGPRGIVLRGPGERDFKDTGDALRQMGLDGWECFHIDTAPPGISFSVTTLRFKRPMEP